MIDPSRPVHEWSPDWAPHVKGKFQDREVGRDGLPEEAHIEAFCTACNATFRRMCASGRPRQWIGTFAAQHLHRNPLAPPSVKP